MSISLLVIIPLLGLLVLSFGVSYNRIKIMFFAILPCFVLMFIFFFVDKYRLDYRLLRGVGTATYQIIAPAFSKSEALTENIYLACGMVFFLMLFFVVYVTLRFVFYISVPMHDPYSKTTTMRIRHALCSLGFFAMSSLLVIYVASGMRCASLFENGFMEAMFEWFVPSVKEVL